MHKCCTWKVVEMHHLSPRKRWNLMFLFGRGKSWKRVNSVLGVGRPLAYGVERTVAESRVCWSIGVLRHCQHKYMLYRGYGRMKYNIQGRGHIQSNSKLNRHKRHSMRRCMFSISLLFSFIFIVYFLFLSCTLCTIS